MGDFVRFCVLAMREYCAGSMRDSIRVSKNTRMVDGSAKRRDYGVGVGDAIHRALGLTDDEAAAIESVLGRAANHLELAMFAVMWSERRRAQAGRDPAGPRGPLAAPASVVTGRDHPPGGSSIDRSRTAPSAEPSKLS